MIRVGENVIECVPVVVERKRVSRISIRISLDGVVRLSMPKWGTSLRAAEAFLRSKWKWVEKTRAEMASRAPENTNPVTQEEKADLLILLDELTTQWAAEMGEGGVTWSVRRMSSLWGSCHVQRRRITYNLELARVPRELVEYIVVHELTHLKESSHGAGFCKLMDERLPEWRKLRRILNKRSFPKSEVPQPQTPKTPQKSQGVPVQGELWDFL